MPKKNILILVGGGRGNWPNFWSARAYQPERIHLIRPAGDDINNQFTCEFFTSRALPFDPKDLDDPNYAPVNAFDKAEAKRQCLEMIKRYADRSVIVNVTTSPKMMAFGAYDAVNEVLLSEPNRSVGVLHLDTVGRTPHAATGVLPPPQDFNVVFEDYLAAYGRTPIATFDPKQLPASEEVLRKIARLLAHPETHFRDMMNQIRTQSGKAHASIKVGGTVWHPVWESVLHALEDNGMIQSLSISGRLATFQFATTKAFSFLDSTWLELYAKEQAMALFEKDTDQPVFRACHMSTKLRNHKVEAEVDVACLSPFGYLLLAECKTKKEVDVAHLKDVVDYAGMVGGAYCGKVYITNVMGPLPPNFVDQAAERKVHIVTGEDLPNLQVKLAKILTNAGIEAR